MPDDFVKRTIFAIKEEVKKNSFQINGHTYVPLHSTSFPLVILSRLEKKGFWIRRKTLLDVLKENNLRYKDYKNIPHIDHLHPGVSCFEILKPIA
ncbi:MAG: hypothetical protein PHP03_01405 [Candidatus Pacebacteria bacterium]|nr:hypothetical protein [Candidatus Paceibacterota bacterium]